MPPFCKYLKMLLLIQFLKCLPFIPSQGLQERGIKSYTPSIDGKPVYQKNFHPSDIWIMDSIPSAVLKLVNEVLDACSCHISREEI